MEEKNGRKNPWRFLFLLAAVLGGLELVGSLAALVLLRIQLDVTEAASIGIIGGADGPTAIFVTASSPGWSQVLVPAVMVGIGIWGYRKLKKG